MANTKATGVSYADPEFESISVTGNATVAGSLVVGGNTISGTELGYVDGITPGTVTASKAVVVDSNKDAGDFRNLDCVNLDAGASGTAGTVDVFPTTASKGKLTISATDNTGNTATTVTNAAMGQASTITIPDPGGSAGTFALLQTSNAFVGSNTFTESVTSGTARKFVGSAFVDVAASDAVTAAASNNSFVAFAQKYTIPANTVKSGTRIRAQAVVRVTDASGTDTLTCEMRVGGTSIVATTAVDPGAAGDHHVIQVEFVGRAAPGAAASCSASGQAFTNTGGTIAWVSAALAAANYATNGALDLDVRAKWSSNTANTSCNLEQLSVEVIG